MYTWIPWIFIGGLVFLLGGFIVSKVSPGVKTNPIQDFVGGAIVAAGLNAVSPGIFPDIVASVAGVAEAASAATAIIGGGGGGAGEAAGEDIQVGPIRRGAASYHA